MSNFTINFFTFSSISIESFILVQRIRNFVNFSKFTQDTFSHLFRNNFDVCSIFTTFKPSAMHKKFGLL